MQANTIKLLINLEDCDHKSEVYSHKVEYLNNSDSESESDEGQNSPSGPVRFLNVADSLQIVIQRNEELCVSESSNSEDEDEEDSCEESSSRSSEHVNQVQEEEKKEESAPSNDVEAVEEAAEEAKFDDDIDDQTRDRLEPKSPILLLSEDSFDEADLHEAPVGEVNYPSIDIAKNQSRSQYLFQSVPKVKKRFFLDIKTEHTNKVSH